MPLVLTHEDLDSLFEEPAFVEEAFQELQHVLLLPPQDPYPVVVLPSSSWEGAVALEVRAAEGGQPCVGLRSYPSAGAAEMLVAADGSLLALAPAESLDTWRLATASGLAARYLAPGAASSLGLYGTGGRAWAFLSVLTRALPSLSIIRIYGRDTPAARVLASAVAERIGLVVTVEDEPDRVVGADVLIALGGEEPPVAGGFGPGSLVLSQTVRGVPAGPGCVRVGPVAGSGVPHLVDATLAEIVRGRNVVRRSAAEPIVYQAGEIPGWESALFARAFGRAGQRR